MFKFLTRRPLWLNVLAGVVLAIIAVVIFLQSLDWLTQHGKTLTIPGVTGKTYPDAKKLLENEGFEVVIQDSVYNDTAAPQIVLRQIPDADAMVKMNRKVYLTINRAVPPTIEMPNLEGLSFRSAEVAIKQYQLKLGDTVYRADFAKNSVLEQVYDGKRIKPGTKITMGSEIDLVLGSGLGEVEFSVPDLFGRTIEEARILLESNGLNMGTILPSDLKDDPAMFVYRQSPEQLTPDGRVNKIRQGQFIDIWVQKDRPVRQIDSTGLPEPDLPND